jgi:S-formylglutathione hydrolase FrmB
MLSLKIPHDYIERPGRHDWQYWATAVQYQLLFFRNYFNKAYGTTVVSTAPQQRKPM